MLPRDWPLASPRLPSGGPIADTLDIRLEPADDPWVDLSAAGLVDCVPFGRTGDFSLALRTAPGRALSACPVVMADPIYREQNLLCDAPRTLVPALVTSLLTRRDGGDWDRVAASSEEDWAALGELDAALGGDGKLAGLRQLVADPAFKVGFCADLRDDEDWPEIQGRGFELALPEGPRRRFHRLMAALDAFEWDETPPGPDLAAYERAAWMVVALDIDDLEVPLGRRAALEAIRQPASHDTWWNASGHWVVDQGVGRSEYAASIQLAESFESWEASASDPNPLVRAAVKLAEAGDRYGGREHLDAARELSAEGDYEGAISALISSCFWQRKRLGYLHPDMLHAVRKATEDAGFEAMFLGIDRMIHELDTTS